MTALAALPHAPSACPACRERLTTTQLSCPACATEVGGAFATCRYCSLGEDEHTCSSSSSSRAATSRTSNARSA